MKIICYRRAINPQTLTFKSSKAQKIKYFFNKVVTQIQDGSKSI